MAETRMPTIPARFGVPGFLIVALAIFLTLSGCGETEDPNEPTNAERQLATAEIACRGGVEYLMLRTTHGYYTATPHLQPDGSPYLCLKLQSPVDPE